MDEDDDDDSHDEEPIIPFDERIASVSNNDPSIDEINLTWEDRGNLTEDQIVLLFRGLQRNTHVRRLYLHLTPRELRRTVCQQLLPPLLRENSAIHYLGFPEDVTNAEFLPSAEVFCNSNNTTATTLNLFRCNICGREGGDIIARIMRSNRHITTISLWGNKYLGPAGARGIAAALGDDNCALRALNVGGCDIGDEGVDVLCTALRVNNSSLEKFRFDGNKITDESYRVLASSLPRASGLKEMGFEWESPRVSGARVQEMMEGLRKNQSLQRVVALRDHNLSEAQQRQWDTVCTFVCARNKMSCHLLGEVRDRTRVAAAAREGRVVVAPVPIPMGPLLRWCCSRRRRRGNNAEVHDSLVYYLLRLRVGEIVGLLADAQQRAGKRRANRTDAR